MAGGPSLGWGGLDPDPTDPLGQVGSSGPHGHPQARREEVAVTANPGHVALVCVMAGALPFEAYDLDTGLHIPTWEAYEADTSLVAYTFDDVAGGLPCEGGHWVLVWLPEDPTGLPEGPVLPAPVEHGGCGRFFTWREK